MKADHRGAESAFPGATKCRSGADRHGTGATKSRSNDPGRSTLSMRRRASSWKAWTRASTFDNAWEYNDGKSEDWLGKALAGRREHAS